MNEIKNQRHTGAYKKKHAITHTSDSEIYDWIVDIDLITKVAKEGWQVKFSKNFLQNSSANIQRHVIGDRYTSSSASNKMIDSEAPRNSLNDQNPANFAWEGAIVAVVGLYDKGKTFCLNNLSFSNLPSGKKVNTKGLSFKYVNLDEGTRLILLDTAGSYSPVKVENNMSIVEKEATEMFQLDLVFDISDYFLFVVNDFTSLDQRYLDK